MVADNTVSLKLTADGTQAVTGVGTVTDAVDRNTDAVERNNSTASNNNAARRETERAAREAEKALKQEEKAAREAAAAAKKLADQQEALRRTYDPIYSATRQFEEKQAQLNNALRMGTFDSSTYSQILTKLQADHKAQLDALTKGAPVLVRHAEATAQAAISAGQLAQANRQLPAQFTDIATSLAGGQSPLLVAIQQGGQIRDAYGSAGLAIKQMATLALGAVNPITVAGAAVAGLGVAAYQGAQEQSALARALVLTGGQAGVSADRLQDTAARVASAVGTQGKAVEVLSGLIAAGVGRGAADLAALTSAAINLERSGGPAVEETSKLFADLAADPLAALRKLSDATGQVGPAAYAQVAALVKLGETAKAGGIAQAEAARIAQEQASKLLPELGYLERAWLGVKDAASGAWDAAKGLGRKDTDLQQIESLQNQIKPNTPTWVKAHLQAQIDALETKRRLSDEAAKAEAATDAKNQKNITAQKDWQALTESNLSAQQRFAEERARIERIGTDKGATAAEIAAQISFARRRILGSQEDQFAQQQADFQGALQKRLDDDKLASIKQRVSVGALTEAEGIRQTAAVEVAAANDRAARLNALARQEQDPSKRAKVYQDAALAVQDALLREAAAKREVIALSEQAAAAYRKELDSQIAAAINSQVTLEQGTAAIQLQTGQLRQHGIVIESVSTLVARQTAARQDAAAAVQISLLQDRLALATAEEERRSIQQTIDKLQTLGTERAKAVTASASKDLAQAGFDQAKRLGAGEEQGAGLTGLKDALSGVTDGANAGLVKMVDSLSTLNTLAREYSREMAVISALQASADPADQVTAQANLSALAEKQGKAQVAAYAQMAGAAASYFDKSSDGYRLLHGAETALRTYQLITSAQSAAADLAAMGRRVTTWLTAETTITGASLAGSTARASGSVLESAAAGVTAVIKAMASLPFPANLAAGAATAAAIASLGVSLGFGGGGSTSTSTDAATADIQARKNTGTGTVFGDVTKQSDSITNSLDSLQKLGVVQTGYAGRMVDLLGSINQAMTNSFTKLLISGTDVSGSSFKNTSSDKWNVDPTAARLLTGFLFPTGGAIGNAFNSIFGSSSQSSTLTGAGLVFDKQTVGQAAKELGASVYQTVKSVFTTESWAGLVKDTTIRNTTTTSRLDGQVTQGWQQVVGQLLAAAQLTGKQLGSTPGKIAALGNLDTGLGSLDLTGKSVDEQSKILTAAFSKLGDQLADKVAPGLKDLANVGEGYLQTLVRLGTQTQYVNEIGQKLGSTFTRIGESGARSADLLIKQFGSTEAYLSATDEYFKNFYTEEEQTASKVKQLTTAFGELGLALPASNAAFRELVTAASNDTSEAGVKRYATLIKLNSAFSDVTKSLDKLQKSAADSAQKLADAAADSAQKLADAAAEVSSKLTASSVKLRDTIYSQRISSLAPDDQFKITAPAVKRCI